MYKKVVYSALLCLFALLMSCEGQREVNWSSATPNKYVDAFSDTVFFKWISDIESENGNWVILDKGAGQTHIVDDKFSYIRSLGKPGPGPAEIKGASNVEVTDETIYIYDYTGRKINSYSLNGDFLQSQRTHSFISEFFIDADKIFVCSNQDFNQPLEMVDLQPDSNTFRFGQAALKELNYPPQHLAKVGEYIVSAFAYNRPVINSYDADGNFVENYDLSDDPILSPWLEEADVMNMIKNSPPGVQRAKTMFWDIYTTASHFYLMTPAIKTEKAEKTSFLIQLSISEKGAISIDNYIHLKVDENWSFNCFAVSEDDSKIIAYDPGNGMLVEFLMQD